MKTSIKLIAMFLFLLMGTGAFASIHPKANRNMSNNRVSLVPLKHSRGFAIMVDKNEPGNSVVFICDINGDCIFKYKLQNGLNSETKYLTTQLPDGQYTVEV